MSTKSPDKVKPRSAKAVGSTRVMREIQRIVNDPSLTQQQALWQITRALGSVPSEKAPSQPDDDRVVRPKGGAA